MTPAQLQPARRLEESYFIEASAGTGKTTTLVDRIVEVLRSGVPVERIAAVTFTNAAAGEMKIRVRQALEDARRSSSDEHERKVLGRAQENLERAFIGTIHAFCGQLLRKRPVEAGIDPSFEELPDPGPLFREVFRPWLIDRIAAGSPPLVRALARVAEWERTEPIRRLESEAWKLVEWRDYSAPWRRAEFDRAAATEAILDKARQLCELRNRSQKREADRLWQRLRPVQDLVERAERAKAAGIDYLDAVEADIAQLPWRMRSGFDGYGPFASNLAREAVVAARDQFLAEVESYKRHSDADIVVPLRDELWQSVALYEAAKRAAGKLDFADLLIKARDLLRHPESCAWIRSLYDRLFIDEFQDTDPLQAEILLTIAGDAPPGCDWRTVAPMPGKLFVVGDPKQSIYRFRRADIGLYRAVSMDLQQRGVTSGQLHRSHRSLEPIQSFVNAAFDGSMPAYLPLSGGRPPLPGQPAVVALPMPEPYGVQRLAKKEIERCSPRTVAAFIEWLVGQSGWVVSEKDEAPRPIEAGDVCILFRRFTSGGRDLAQEYVRALEARGIEHVLVGSKSLHQREEVAAVRTALRAIEWPEDELSVYATLRNFFAVLDATLFECREQYGRLHPLTGIPLEPAGPFEDIRTALDFLREAHERRNDIPIAATINRLLEATRAHAAFAFRKGGRRALANVCRVVDLARSFESREATSFRSFLDYLEAEAEEGEAGEAPIFEQTAEGVKLMTVHKAKGLEFPVVILADLTGRLTAPNGCDRYIDALRGLCAQRLLTWAPPDLLDHEEEEKAADLEEGYRLAYVAATRARDLLVVSAVGVPEFLKEGAIGESSWLSPLYSALYPSRELWRSGSPADGHRTVVKRPRDWQDDEDSVRPGLHRVGNHEVFWFDPAQLDLTDTKQPGLDHELALKGTPEQIRSGEQRYRAWQEAREVAIEAGRRSSIRVAGVQETGALAAAVEVEEIRLPHTPGRPSGRPFGRLVHSLLERSGSAEWEQLAPALARQCGAAESDVAPAVAAVRAALDSSLLGGAAKARRVHREYPVMVRLDDGRLAEGRADLVYFDGECWTVIDYKTGPSASKRNRQQLQLYALALQRATGQRVRAVLLEV
jgi:ATP-dependent helicase/nuclease subunit A